MGCAGKLIGVRGALLSRVIGAPPGCRLRAWVDRPNEEVDRSNEHMSAHFAFIKLGLPSHECVAREP